ncbi:MAG: hypothetical protein LH615_15680, partial [Ferruginibacter sp.]|nr:hypothetical protein [Ferruginibacter sp.]
MKQISTKMITSAINKVAILFIATIVFFSHASHAQVTPAQSQFLFAEDFNYTAGQLTSAPSG